MTVCWQLANLLVVPRRMRDDNNHDLPALIALLTAGPRIQTGHTATDAITAGVSRIALLRGGRVQRRTCLGFRGSGPAGVEAGRLGSWRRHLRLSNRKRAEPSVCKLDK